MDEEGGGGLFSRVGDAWNSFLDWSEEKGLPLKNFSLWLEEKGIPSLPAFLILLIAVGALAYFFIIAPMQAPQTSKVTIYAFSADGAPLSGVSVTLSNAGFQETATTGSDGIAVFNKVPLGTATATVNSAQYVFEKSSFPVVVEGTPVQATARTISLAGNKISLSVRIEGASTAKILLLDSGGQIIDSKDGVDNAQFDLTAGLSYKVRAEAEGFSPADADVTAGTSNLPPVTLVLVKIGEKARDSITIGVFDSSGALGNPIKGASVTIADAATGNELFSLTAGEDGIAEIVELDLGSNITITASAEGFATQTLQEVFSKENNGFKIRLETATPANAAESVVRVLDENGNAISNPIVRLHEAKGKVFVSEQTPEDGRAVFEIDSAKAYFATVFKPGFLPEVVEKLEKGKTTEVKLQDATAENSGSVRVRVQDKNGADVSEASVDLVRTNGMPVGIPPRVTGVDGSQEFADVPLVEVKAIASKGARSGESQSRLVSVAGDAEENATVLLVQFPPETGRVQVTVKDFYSEAPVAGATVLVRGGNSVSCTTSKDGTCEAKVLESESATVKITAVGFEDFESAVFAVLPNALVQKDVPLQPKSVQSSVKLQFVGVFDLDGNKVNSLNPFETYDARYVITAPSGLEFSKARAHIRVGAQDASFESEPVVITAYDAFGASVKRGTDYSQASSGVQSGTSQKQEVVISEIGFSPQVVEITEGGSITWRVQGELQHAILSDDGGFGSNALKDGGTYVRSFSKAGSFSYRDSLHPEFVGTIVVRAKQTQSTTTTQTTLAQGFKWVDFEFSKFTGSKELRVQIKSVASKGVALLSHRSAFVTTRGVLRSPEDDEAGVSKDELLGKTDESGRFEISFRGTCSGNVCLQYYFEQEGAQSQNDFEALYPDSFRLQFKLAADARTQVELSTDSDAIELENAQGDLEVEQASANDVRVVLEKSGSGFFSIKPKKLSEAASLTIKAGSIERQLKVRIASKTAPILKPEVKPSVLTALSDNTVTVRVKDSLGFDVEAAVVLIGSEFDAVGTQVQATTTGKAGEYSANVQPKGAGFVEYSIEKQGYRKVSGRISATAPTDFIDVSPESIQVTLSTGNTLSTKFSLSNKINNEVQVSLSLSLEGSPQFTEVALGEQSVRLKKLQSNRDVTLAVGLSPDLLEIADTAKTLSERVSGSIKITARIGGIAFEKNLPFDISSSFTQQGLSDLWQPGSDMMEFSVSTKETTDEQTLRVANNGPYPLLINQESEVDEISLSPAYLEVPALGEGEFVIRAKMPSSFQNDCMRADETKEGNAVLFASFAGIRSSKQVGLNVDLTQDQACLVQNGVSVQLPIDVSFSLPLQQKRSKINPDGSTIIELPSKERVLFDSGTTLSEAKADVPMNSKFYLQSSRVTRASNGIDVIFPFESSFLIPSDSPVQNSPNGGPMVALPNTIITFPSGTTFSSDESALTAVVQANARISFQDVTTIAVVETPTPTPSVSPSPGVDCLLNPWLCQPSNSPYQFPPTGAMNPIPTGGKTIKLPVNARLFLPSNAYVIEQSATTQNPAFSQYYAQYSQQNLAGFRGVLLQNGVQFAFDSQSQLLSQSSGLILSVPADATLIVPPQAVVQIDKESYRVILPVQTQLLYSTSLPNPFKDKTGYVVQLGEKTALQFSFNPIPTTEENQRVIFLSAYQSFSVIGGKAVQNFEDKSLYNPCDSTFTATKDSEVELPAGTTFTEEGSNLVAIFPSCDENNRITIKTVDGKNVYSPPLTKKIIVPDGSNEENLLEIPAGSKMVFKTCDKLSNGKKIPTKNEVREAKYYFATKTAVELPPGVHVSDNVVSLSGFKKVRVESDLQFQELGVTDKIKLSSFQNEKTDPTKKTYVMMPEDSSISFVPYCNKAASGSFEISESANFFSITDKNGNNEWVVELSNKKLFEQGEFCLKNKGSFSLTVDTPIVEPQTDYFVQAMPNDALHMHSDPQQIFGGPQAFDLPGLPEDEKQCNKYFITAVVPPNDLIDYGSYKCINPKTTFPNTIEGFVSFPLSHGDVKYESNNKLHVTIKITNNQEDCAGAVAVQGEASVSDLRVNYAAESSQFNPQATVSRADGTAEQLFSFKDKGHVRYLVISNGFDENIELKVDDKDSALECFQQKPSGSADKTKKLETGLQIPIGNTFVFECTSLKNTVWSPITIEAVGLSSKETRSTKNVNVVVFTPDDAVKEFYSSSPLGRVYPLRNKDLPEGAAAQPSTAPAPPNTPTPTTQAPAGSQSALQVPAAKPVLVDDLLFPYCETNFCVYQQAIDAYSSFLKTVSNAVDAATPDLATTQELCNRLGTGVEWKKSFALQLTNTRVNVDSLKDLNDVNERIAKEGSFGVDKLKQTGVFQPLQGCGIYLVEARLNPGECVQPAAAENDFKKIKKQFLLQTTITKLVSCPETLQNAALLMPPDDTKAIAGNDIIDGGVDFRWREMTLPFMGEKSVVPTWSFGRYTKDQSSLDAETVDVLVFTMYGSSQNKIGASESSQFEDEPARCDENLLQVHRFENGLLATGVGSAIGSVLSIGGGNPVLALKLAQVSVDLTTVKLKVAAASGTLLKSSGEKFKPCEIKNFAGHLSLTLQVEAVVNAMKDLIIAGNKFGSVGKFSSQGFNAFLSSSLVTSNTFKRELLFDVTNVAGDAGGYALMAVITARSDEPHPSLVYFGGKAIGLTAGGLANRLIGGKIVSTAAGSSGAAIASFFPAKSFVERQVSDAVYSKASALRVPGPEALKLANQFSVLVDKGLVDSSATYKLAIGRGISKNIAQQSAYLQLANSVVPSISAGSVGSPPMIAFVEIAEAARDSILSMYSSPAGKTGWLRTAFTWMVGKPLSYIGKVSPGTFAAGLATGMFQVESRPVGALLNQDYSNYILASHYEGDVTSLDSYCYYKNKNCLERREFDRAQCPEDKDSCLVFSRLNPPADSVQSKEQLQPYIISAFVNDEAALKKSEPFFYSLFDPDTQPTEAKNADGLQAVMVVPQSGETSAIGKTIKPLTDAERNKLNEAVLTQTAQYDLERLFEPTVSVLPETTVFLEKLRDDGLIDASNQVIPSKAQEVIDRIDSFDKELAEKNLQDAKNKLASSGTTNQGGTP